MHLAGSPDLWSGRKARNVIKLFLIPYIGSPRPLVGELHNTPSERDNLWSALLARCIVIMLVYRFSGFAINCAL
jgi:hypothetical protein